MVLYKCSNIDCSFNFLAINNSITECPCCMEKVDIISEDNNISINECIPFKYDKEMVSILINKYMRKNLFIPSIFKKKNTVDNIVQVYLPFSLYDVLLDGNMTFISNDYNYWKDKTYNYKETSSYRVKSNGHFEFNNILYSNNLFNDFSRNQRFNYRELNKMDLSNMNNILIGINDLNSKNNMDDIKIKCIDTCVLVASKSIEHQDNRLENNDINITDVSNKDILLPYFILNVGYKNKKYRFVVNGQTGKVIFDGVSVVSISKIVVFGILLFIGILFITSLIMYFIYRVF